MLDALDQLGLHLKWIDNGETLLIQGSEGKFDVPKKPVYLGNAGTASRYVIF
jgi:pentafunctional AROM polypeptide